MNDRDNEHQDEFWGDDDPPHRRDRPARGGGGMSSQQRKAIPIVAAAAALLLIVVIFVVSRNSDNKKSTSPTTIADTNQATNAAPLSRGSVGAPTSPSTTKKKIIQWPVGVVGAPKVFEGPSGRPSRDVPEPGKEPPPGIYLWIGYDGWQIRVVRGDGIDEVKGSAQGNEHGTLDKVTIEKVINADPSAVTVDNRNLNFDFGAGGERVTGVKFSYELFTDQVEFRFDGPTGPIDASKIHTGAGVAAVPSNPIRFTRAAAATPG